MAAAPIYVSGWRVGWITGPARLVEAARVVHAYSTFCAPTPLQVCGPISCTRRCMGWISCCCSCYYLCCLSLLLLVSALVVLLIVALALLILHCYSWRCFLLLLDVLVVELLLGKWCRYPPMLLLRTPCIGGIAYDSHASLGWLWRLSCRYYYLCSVIFNRHSFFFRWQ